MVTKINHKKQLYNYFREYDLGSLTKKHDLENHLVERKWGTVESVKYCRGSSVL